MCACICTHIYTNCHCSSPVMLVKDYAKKKTNKRWTKAEGDLQLRLWSRIQKPWIHVLGLSGFLGDFRAPLGWPLAPAPLFSSPQAVATPSPSLPQQHRCLPSTRTAACSQKGRARQWWVTPDGLGKRKGERRLPSSSCLTGNHRGDISGAKRQSVPEFTARRGNEVLHSAQHLLLKLCHPDDHRSPVHVSLVCVSEGRLLTGRGWISEFPCEAIKQGCWFFLFFFFPQGKARNV